MINELNPFTTPYLDKKLLVGRPLACLTLRRVNVPVSNLRGRRNSREPTIEPIIAYSRDISNRAYLSSSLSITALKVANGEAPTESPLASTTILPLMNVAGVPFTPIDTPS